MRRGNHATLLLVLLLAVVLAACSGRPPVTAPGEAQAPRGTYKLGQAYQINGVWYYPEYDPSYDVVGTASWYGDAFHGKPTANGEIFDMRLVSAAHPTLPMPSLVEVTNLDNGRKLQVRMNDRGPFHGDRVIDLSRAAARELGFEGQGLAKVRVRFLALLPANGVPPVAGATTRPRTAVASAVGRPAAVRPIASGATPCGADDHFVQVAAFGEPANALRLSARLDGLGPVEVATASSVARVRLGPYPSRDDAVGKLAQVRDLGYADAHLVSCS